MSNLPLSLYIGSQPIRSGMMRHSQREEVIILCTTASGQVSRFSVLQVICEMVNRVGGGVIRPRKSAPPPKHNRSKADCILIIPSNAILFKAVAAKNYERIVNYAQIYF